MAIHTIGYYKSANSPSTDVSLTPVSDPTVTIDGNDIYVPSKYNKVIRAYAMFNDTNTGYYHHLEAPSLREMFYPYFADELVATGSLLPRGGFNLDDNPIQLVTNEGLEFHTSQPSTVAAAVAMWGVLSFSDAKITPASGKIFTIRTTSAPNANSTGWGSGTLTFGQSLPVGTYDIVGMRFESLTGVAARLVFIGSSAVTRPGVISNFLHRSYDIYKQRYGNLGTFGTFDSTNPPSVEFLGNTDASVPVYLDLIKK